MTKPAGIRDRYHHGDLKAKLIGASAEALCRTSIDALSLRKIAEAVGVSHNAPYMHFQDKEALLAHVAMEGFAMLKRSLEEMLESQARSKWKARFHSGCLCYVQFCLENPGYVAAMFRKYDSSRFPELIAKSMESIEPLFDVLEHGKKLGVIKRKDTGRMASAVWSMLHGLTSILAGREDIPEVMGEKDVDRLVRSHVELLLVGIAPRTG